MVSYAEHSADSRPVGKDQFLRLAAKGALGDDGTWRGQVRELAASHPC